MAAACRRTLAWPCEEAAADWQACVSHRRERWSLRDSQGLSRSVDNITILDFDAITTSRTIPCSGGKYIAPYFHDYDLAQLNVLPARNQTPCIPQTGSVSARCLIADMLQFCLHQQRHQALKRIQRILLQSLRVVRYDRQSRPIGDARNASRCQ